MKIGVWSFVVRYKRNDRVVGHGYGLHQGKGFDRESARLDAISKAAESFDVDPSVLYSVGAGSPEDAIAMEIEDQNEAE